MTNAHSPSSNSNAHLASRSTAAILAQKNLFPCERTGGEQIQERLPQPQKAHKISRPDFLSQLGYSRFLAAHQLVFVHVKIPLGMRANLKSPFRVIGRDGFLDLMPCPAIDIVGDRSAPLPPADRTYLWAFLEH